MRFIDLSFRQRRYPGGNREELAGEKTKRKTPQAEGSKEREKAWSSFNLACVEQDLESSLMQDLTKQSRVVFW